MSDVKHTAGPWDILFNTDEIGATGDFYTTAVVQSKIDNVCIVDIESQEDKANANLIAATPELLEALKELHSAECAPYPREEEGSKAQHDWAARKVIAHRQAKAAIAKAEGGEE